MTKIIQERFAEAIEYDAETGMFRRRVILSAGSATGWFCGTNRGDGYLQVRVSGTRMLAHRLAWVLVHGTTPVCIDHINRDPGDNRLCNLRAVSQSLNNHNRGNQRNNTSGFKGVAQHGTKWRAKFQHEGRVHRLGGFATAEAAALARATWLQASATQLVLDMCEAQP